ncbi:MAG: hypothetical protein ACJ0SL_06860 [Candidatus Rariloculaceae bacterium]
MTIKNVTSRVRQTIAPITAAVATYVLLVGSLSAQFNPGMPGQMQLPADDFTWVWGQTNDRDNQFEDISVSGSDGFFRCNLRGKLSIGTRMTSSDVRALENELRGELNFVQLVTYRMNELDARRDLQWATLECKKPERSQESQGMSGVRIRPRD